MMPRSFYLLHVHSHSKIDDPYFFENLTQFKEELKLFGILEHRHYEVEHIEYGNDSEVDSDVENTFNYRHEYCFRWKEEYILEYIKSEWTGETDVLARRSILLIICIFHKNSASIVLCMRIYGIPDDIIKSATVVSVGKSTNPVLCGKLKY